MNDVRGTIIQKGNLMVLDNAYVEEAVFYNDFSGYILVSYYVTDANQNVSLQNLRLNIGRNTAVMNSAGQCLNLSSIKEGSLVDAVFSPAMTRSIPPQSSAYLIMVSDNQGQSESVTTARITYTDAANYLIYTGDPYNPNNQTIFVVTPSTLIYDASGRQINF